MLARLEAGIARERRFVADASHELRTPLALLRTELELARRRPRPPEELRAALDSAAEEVDRLTRLAEDLLVLARVDEGRLSLRPEKIDVKDLLETVAGRFSEPIEVGAADGDSIVGDRLRLEQALGNLLDNARRHGAGTIRLEAERKQGRLELRVSDQGPGFSPELLPRAFDRFTRGDEARERGGTGLGLAIVAAVAKAHRGRARAAGSTVTIELPG
jgi:two-component system OmpR family sensor kinase